MGDNLLGSGPSSGGYGYGDHQGMGYGIEQWMGCGGEQWGYGDEQWMDYGGEQVMGYDGQPGLSPIPQQQMFWNNAQPVPSSFNPQRMGNRGGQQYQNRGGQQYQNRGGQQYQNSGRQQSQNNVQQLRQNYEQQQQILKLKQKQLEEEFDQKLQNILQKQLYSQQEGQLMQEQQQEGMGKGLQIKVPNHIEATNLRHMIKTGQDYLKVEDNGFIKFATEQRACEANFKWKSDPNQDQRSVVKQGQKTTKKRGYEISFISSDEFTKIKAESDAKTLHRQQIVGHGGSAGKRARKVKSWTKKSLDSEKFEWCTVQEFSSEDKFVKPFQFAAATKYASVSPDVVLCEATNVGNLVFLSVLSFLFAQHLAKRTYKGKVKLEDIVVSRKLRLCAILKESHELLDPRDAQADVVCTVECLLPLYKINENLPAYYEFMINRSRKAPENTIDAEALKEYHKEMLREICFAPKEIRIFVAREFHVNYKNLAYALKKKYDDSAPKHLEDWQPITKVDRLLDDIITDGIPLGDKFGDEGSHIRHLVEHAPDRLKALKLLFPLIERDMLVFYYFKKYLPEFVDLMYKERGNQEWLDGMCESYEHGRLVMGTVPCEAIPHALDFESDEEEGETGEEEILQQGEEPEASSSEASTP